MKKTLILSLLLTLSINLFSQIKVTSSNFVGISTLNPLCTFQINDSYKKIAFGSANTQDLQWGTAYFGFNAVRKNDGNWLSLNDNSTSNGGSVIFGSLDGSINFSTLQSTGNTEQSNSDANIYSKIAFKIKGSGNIVIGNNNFENYKLNINSNTNQSAFSTYTNFTTDWSWAQVSYVNRSLTKSWVVDLNGSHNFFVNGEGTIWGRDLISISDSSTKENIKPLSNTREKLAKLKPCSYNFKNHKDKHYGFLAQDVENIFPDIVHTQSNGLKGISYQSLIPIIIEEFNIQLNETMKLSNKIDSLSTEVEKLKKELFLCCNKTTKRLKSSLEINSVNKNDLQHETVLYQNNPNPFSDVTTINFFISDVAQNVKIYVFDMNGSLLKSYNIEEKGKGELKIHNTEFSQGMYIYTLMVNNVEIDSKRMILVK